MSFALNYQAFLDKINNRVPIKWLTRPIDKIHPLASLILFVLIIAVILLLIFKPFGAVGEKEEYITFTIGLADSNGQLLKNFEFQLNDSLNGITQNYRTDSKGQTTVELNKFGDYSIIVDKKGYKYKDEIIDLSKTKQNFIVELFVLASIQEKSLRFVGTNGQAILESLNVTITCQDGSSIDPSTSTVTTGTSIFNVPVSCTKLVATAIGTNYSGQNIVINQETGIVTVPPKAINTSFGQATVKVKSGTNFLDGITLRVYKEGDSINPVTSGQSQFGSRRFPNLEVGNYIVVATDDSLRYQTAETEFIITKNIETQVSLELNAINTPVVPGDTVTTITTKDIRVIVKDEDTSLEIDGVIPTSILLITDVNGTKQTVDTKQYTTAGVTFRIDTSKAYSLTIRSQGYIPENRDITPNVADYMIFLEKETVSNISDINVSVVDEDNLPVIGGTLLIYDGNSNYQDTRFTSVVTDNNGTATFDNIPKGYYFIKLRKVNVINQSGKFTHNPPIDTNMVMTINIGEGTISFNIKNINQETIDFANVKIYDVIGNEIGVDQALQNGTYTRKIKADKVIYVKISKEGYLDYYTELLPIITNETITKEIRLNRVGTITTPTVELVGLYNQQDINASFLAQNSRYYFKFKLINPSAGNIGIRFVVGEQDTAEEDIVYIKPITNSKANISYYSNINLTAVQQDTFAKVIDATFINASQGVYEIQIPVSTVHALRGQAVPIYYSVFTGSPTSIDNLGNQRVYYIDVSEICSENFCISGQFVDTADDIVYDLEAGVNSLVVNKNYDFKYILTNAKSNVYTSNRLAITNVDTTTELETQAINILSYNIFGGGFLQTSTSGNQIRNKMPFTSDYLPSTQINVYDKINIDTTIKPVLLGTTRIQNKIISNQSVVYNEFINFNVAQEYPFTISYEPQNIVPGKPFTLTVTALDNSVLPVSGALVNIYQKLANNQQVTVTSGTYRTDDYGTVAIPIPALNNSEKIIISVEKSGYYAVPVEITINQDILSLKQGTAVVTETSPFIINVRKSNPEGSEKTITIINKTNYSLQLKPFRDDSFSFRYSNYINVSQLQQYLNSQVPSIIIPANGETDLDIKLSASQDTTNLTETLNITGNIIGYVTVDNSQAEYAFNIPMAVKVSVGEGVEEDDCLVVNGVSNPWQAVVSGNDTTSVSFDIVNNCKVKGNDEESITLKTLRAKMVNQKDQYGYYTLNVDGRTITLSEGSYTTLLNDLSPGVHSAILTYYSLDKKMGDIETKIYINAQIETDTGLKYVNTTKDIAFTTEIAIRKIEDCIDFYDGSQKINNMLVITKETIEGQSKEIVIKNNCSTLGTFKLSFCGEDKGYTGCQELRYSNMEGYLQNQLSFNLGTD
ncbi:MAG: prealbumin-like fold domain-containing protein, partial [archaeon]